MAIHTHPGTYWKYLRPIDGRVVTIFCCRRCWYEWIEDTAGVSDCDGGFPHTRECPACTKPSRYLSRMSQFYAERETPVALSKIRRRITRQDRQVPGQLFDGSREDSGLGLPDGRPRP